MTGDRRSDGAAGAAAGKAIAVHFSLCRRRTIRALLLVGALLLPHGGVIAAEETTPSGLHTLSLEELLMIEVDTVTSASKYEQKVTEAPSAVTVITAEDIRTYGYRTLADILESVRGFFISYDRSYHSLGIRGFGRPGDRNTRVLLLVDGHRVNDNVFNAGPLGNDFVLDADLIDRVEISRGPGSSLYGSNAFFAVVNIRLRRGADLQGGELSVKAGSERMVGGRATLGREWQNGTAALLSASAGGSTGGSLYFPEYDPANPFADPRANNGGIAEDRDGEGYRNALASARLRGFTLTGTYAERTKDIPTAVAGSDFNVAGSETFDRRAYLDLNYDGRLGPAAVALRAYYDAHRSTGHLLYAGTVNEDGSAGDRLGGEAQFGFKLNGAQRVVVGAEYIGDLRLDQWNRDQNASASYLDDERRARTWALYAQDEIAAADALMLNLGIRYDAMGTGESMLNPRAAAIVTPARGSTVKAIYGSAFRAPSVRERYYASPTASPPHIGNPDLKPEKIKTYELVYEQYLAGGMLATVDAYHYDIADLISKTTSAAGTILYQNVDQVRAQGIEIELERKWLGGAEARLSYALQRASGAATDDALVNFPQHLAKIAISVPWANDRFRVNVEEHYRGARKTLAGSSVDDAAITNVTLLGRDRKRSVEVTLTVRNIFDAAYFDPVADEFFPLYVVQQDGRSVQAKVTYAF